MGNETSQSSNRMAISAMSHMMKITKSELLSLRDQCILNSEKGNDVETLSGRVISRAEFQDAMSNLNISPEPDYQVLDKLFVMWDNEGTDRLDPLEFLAGVSPLASVLDFATKLLFAFEVFDFEKTGEISRKGLFAVLGGINATASYFGDAVLPKMQVSVIVEDIFDAERLTENDAIIYSEKIDRITAHPLVVEFISGTGTARHGTNP